MIACACGMSEWSVEWECVLQANGWVNGEWMELMWSCCMGSVQHRLKTVLSYYEACVYIYIYIYIYIYTMIGVCDRETREWPERDKREKTGIKSVRFEDCFLSLTGLNGSKEHTHQASQQHYICNNCNCYVCAEWSACRSDSFPAQYHVLCSCSRWMNYWYFWFLL